MTPFPCPLFRVDPFPVSDNVTIGLAGGQRPVIIPFSGRGRCLSRGHLGNPGMKILFVENHDQFVSVVTREFLSDHEVRTVPRIADALRELNATRFDVILVPKQA